MDTAVKIANVLREQPRRILLCSDTDERLLTLYREHGKRWRKISALMGGVESAFSEDVCRNRVLRMLEKAGEKYVPSVDRKQPAKPRIVGRWTSQEDERLFNILANQELQTNDWATIVQHFSGRTKQGVRNRAQRIKRVVEALQSNGDGKEDGSDDLAQKLRLQLSDSQIICFTSKRRRNRGPRTERRAKKEQEEEEEEEADSTASTPAEPANLFDELENAKRCDGENVVTPEECGMGPSSPTDDDAFLEFELYLPTVPDNLSELGSEPL